MKKTKPSRFGISAAFLVALVLFGAFYKNDYILHVGVLVFMNITLGCSLRLINLSGQLSLAHGGFVTLGAYTSAALLVKAGVSSTWLALLISGVLAAFIAVLIGIPFTRLRGIYFTMVGIFFVQVIIIAGLQDREAVQSLGIDIDKYFALVFMLGSALASLGGILYAPISSVHPYMGFRVVTLCFAVVIVGGLGNLKGTAIASYALGMVTALTAWFWGPAADAMIFAVMAVVLIFRPIEL